MQNMESGSAAVTVFWQPGCTSCLRAKEFLESHSIDYVSVNVLEDPQALEHLRVLGVRTVPVVLRGDAFVLGQDIDELARFVGVMQQRARLPIEQLVTRLDRLLQIAASNTRAIPAERLFDLIPRRARRYGDLAYHMGMIVHGFLTAARGGTLTYDFYEALTPPADFAPERLARGIESVQEALGAWWCAERDRLPPTVDAYFGRRALHDVLERTAWHVAQHCRQLEFVVDRLGSVSPENLTAADLDGLPVPEGIWDREIVADFER